MEWLELNFGVYVGRGRLEVIWEESAQIKAEKEGIRKKCKVWRPEGRKAPTKTPNSAEAKVGCPATKTPKAGLK